MTTQQESGADLGVRRILPAYRQVSDQLRDKITAGELPPGSKLPNETEMSTLFGVSRSTIREALRELSSQSLVRTKRGVAGGTFVVSPDPAEITQFLEGSLGLMSASNDVTVAELVEFREMLEVPAAGLAAVRGSADDVAVLQEIMHAEAEQSQFEGHRKFHQAVLEASGNSLLEMVARPIFSTLRARFLRDSLPEAFWERVAAEHALIFAAIVAGDRPAAEREMEAHLDALGAIYESIDRAGAHS